ncbi:MAG TPA: YifB family Mg chelatase-like AAA ATPase [Oscillospiraceae bacterium]|nr:YifB family Mg chelatase-like AAA ATPase [Oscillospiraceae bacterium]
MFAKINSVGLLGLNSYMVEVEVDLSQGKYRFDIVGLPDAAVSESRERVVSAIKNSGMIFEPTRHVTVNLAPADTRKEGALYDLPILTAILAATKQINADLSRSAFIGELSLSGKLRRINGVLPMVIAAKENGMRVIYVPFENADEGAVVEGIQIYPVRTIRELVNHLNGKSFISPVPLKKFTMAKPDALLPDFSDVKGQYEVKRSLEVAAAGGHNVIMIGPPGSGKSMLAKRVSGILPDMTFDEALETTKIYSLAGELKNETPIINKRPFRSPHHTVSSVGLSGGGSVPKPGELSLSHNGVLFLDELPEFPRVTMEVLRQPMENGTITISRAACTLTYPCDVMVICAMNPCPCGYYGHPEKPCRCPKGAPSKYLAKVSGPLLDRLDIHIEVPQVNYSELSDNTPSESSASIRERVNRARKIQQERFSGTGINCNAKMTSGMTRKYCKLSNDAAEILKTAFERLDLSARAYDKILRISRTIADLDGSLHINTPHIMEAVQYRSLDRKFWNATNK